MSEELDNALCEELEKLVTLIEKCKDVELVEETGKFLKLFHAYLKNVRAMLKPIQEVGSDMVKGLRQLFHEGGWDITWVNKNPRDD